MWMCRSKIKQLRDALLKALLPRVYLVVGKKAVKGDAISNKIQR